jgi:septal ring factor EnvC (AmiA/AmiB activator)
MTAVAGCRRRRLHWLGGCLLCLALALALAALRPVLAASSAETRAKTAELQQLRARIGELRKSLQATRGRQDKVRQDLRRVEETIGHVLQSLRQVRSDMDQAQRRLADLERRRQSLRQRLGKDRQRLAQQLRASYVMGRQEQLKLLLNQTDPSRVERALVYYDYLNRARTRRIRASMAKLKDLHQVETAIAVKRAQLQKIQGRYQGQREALERSRAERKHVLAALNAEAQTKDQRLQGMLANEQRLEKVIKALQQALSDIPMDRQLARPFATLKGRLPWPVRGRIVVHYGSRRGVGRLRWRGVLIKAPAGAPVRAISHGRVAFADWLRGYGLLLIIDHGNGFMTLYGHNQSLYKDVGEWVEAGELVASVGNSGGEPENGLYFAIRRKGHPVNPVRWCRSAHGTLVGVNP